MSHNHHKRPEREPEWSIVLEDASLLRCVVEAVLPVMQRVLFKIAKRDNRYFLMVDGADQGGHCYVSARLLLDRVVVGDEDEFTFCVNCKHLKGTIDNTSCAHGSLVLEGRGDKLRVVVKDPDQPSYEDHSEVSLLDDSDQPPTLSELDLKMVLEIDVHKLREIVKKASLCHAERMRVRIFVREQGSVQHSLVIFSINGDFYYSQRFCHVATRDEDGSLRVRVATDGDANNPHLEMKDDECVYEHVFHVDKINNFIKPLPCRMIIGKVHQGYPLMLTHALGGTNDDSSHVRFLVAPIREDDD